MRVRISLLLFVFISFSFACVRPSPRSTAPDPRNADVEQLWQSGTDIAGRDLLHGPGGEALMPDPAARYTFVAEDRGGYSKGYDVGGPNGVRWSVKLGPEAQPEVVSSRVLWAIGYHQPPTYYLRNWTMEGGPGGLQPEARFRPELPDQKVVGEWSWYENEFVATQPFKGLLVANLILNNWDWMTSNNKIYEVASPNDDGMPQRVYVVRDLGASLGKTSFPTLLKWIPVRGFGQGSRNDLEGFEQQGFIKGVDGGRVKFDYRGIHKPLLETLSADDVVWTCERLAQVSDAQWDDAFRAAGYSPDVIKRYVAKLKSKIADGLALRDRQA